MRQHYRYAAFEASHAFSSLVDSNLYCVGCQWYLLSSFQNCLLHLFSHFIHMLHLQIWGRKACQLVGRKHHQLWGDVSAQCVHGLRNLSHYDFYQVNLAHLLHHLHYHWSHQQRHSLEPSLFLKWSFWSVFPKVYYDLKLFHHRQMSLGLHSNSRHLNAVISYEVADVG